MKKILMTGCALILLNGCASTATPFSYNEKNSKALNYVMAAGMDANLRDMDIPKDTVTSITHTSSFALASSIAAYNSPIPGFSPSKMAGLDIVSWFLLPKSASSRNSIFAWMPVQNKESKEEALIRIADTIFDAGMKAATEMGFTAKGVQDDNRRNNVVAFRDVKNLSNCKNTEVYSTCIVNFLFRNPKKVILTPSFLPPKKESWFFNPKNKYESSSFAFPKNAKGINELDFLIKSSAYLPSWIYFYVTPKKIWLNEKDSVKIPLVINQGKVHYFVKP